MIPYIIAMKTKEGVYETLCHKTACPPLKTTVLKGRSFAENTCKSGHLYLGHMLHAKYQDHNSSGSAGILFTLSIMGYKCPIPKRELFQ